MTTRSQAQQYQQLIKNMGTDRFLDGKASAKTTTATDRNNNNNNFISEEVGSINNGSLANSRRSTASSVNTSIATATTAVIATSNDKRIQQQLQQHHQQQQQLLHQQQTSSSAYERQGALANCAYLPITPQKVLECHDYYVHLTSHEKKEILQYSSIFFIGKQGIKKKTPHTSTTFTGADGFDSKVVGFDDNNGSYMPVLHDHIAYRYEVLKIIGKGTFGVVLQAYDHKTHESVALKVIRNQARFHTQAKEEIKILTKLLDHDADDKFNVVHMYNNFTFRNHTCIVFELLSLNLYELSRKNSFHGFTLSLIRRFTYSIVRCLEALSRFDIIHCDLKPENILLKQQNRSGIKVIDFGSSCFSNKRIHTYIQSRYYRSPEVILCGKYGPSIDMWSLGCILVELYIGRPLLDGENEADQMACMMELLNVPPPTFYTRCKSTKVRQFIDIGGNPIYCARYTSQGHYEPESGLSPRGKIRGPPGSRILLDTCKDVEFKDFVRQCLVWDPFDRMTPAQAFRHPWLSNHRGGQGTAQEYNHDLMC